MESVTIGLDIGSSAVRAAELRVKDRKHTLRRYGQVGLPPGYVVDGEINNIPGVAAALRRLWGEAGFSSTEVILGVSGPRVFVRQADVPAMNAEDLRSSLKFDAQEMIPIPMEEASFDFSLLDSAPTISDDGKSSRRILLVAAHRDLLRSYMATLKEAGLSASVMDAAPLALLRSVPRSSSEEEAGTEVLVSIGAELTTVAVTQDGVPHFIRSLNLGGAKLTEKIANAMHIEMAIAERLKRGAVPGDTPQLAQARKAMAVEMTDLAEEVRATIDFFLAQSPAQRIDRLIITGGASQTAGLANRIAGNLPTPVVTLNPLAGLDTSALGFDEPATQRIMAASAVAIGLARWPTDAPLIRLNMLPEEVAAARRSRRLVTVAGAAVTAVAGVLAAAGAGQVLAVHAANQKAVTEQDQVTALTGQVNHLQALTAVHSEALARATLDSAALQGDIDWVRVIGQLSSVMPTDLYLTGFTGTRTITTTGSSSASTGKSASTSVGTVAFTVKGTGGLPAAAAWVQGLQSDPDLSGVWLNGVTEKSNGGAVNFTSNADLTPLSQSSRAKEVHG